MPCSGLVSNEGVLPPNVLRALSKLEDRYSFSSLMGEQVLALTTEALDVSGALVPDKALVDLDIPEGIKIKLRYQQNHS